MPEPHDAGWYRGPMTRSLLGDAFAHHVWATLRLIDTCRSLSPEQLGKGATGTYGSILETMRHTVGADVSYLSLLSGGHVVEIDEDGMDLPALRTAMAADGPVWAEFLAGDPDPELIVVRHRDDGSESSAPLGVRTAQALHHGTDHRSQICTALTALGIEPPDIDVWAFAAEQGRLDEVPAPGS